MEHGISPFKWVKPNSLKLPKIGTTEPDEINYDEAFEAYLADASCMNSGSLRTLLKSPRHYIAEKAGMHEDEDGEKDHFRFGRAAHMLVLEPAKFKQLHLVQPDFGAMQSPKNRAKRDEWRDGQPTGSLILTQKEMDDLLFMIDSLMEHPEIPNLLKNGRPEVSGRWTDKETLVRCRCRPDYLTNDSESRLYISDIKTTRQSGEGLFSTDAARFKYFVQLAYYHDGIAQILKQQPEAVALIAMEKKRPYDVSLYWMNEKDLELGRLWYQHALRTYVRCVKSNRWPGVQQSGQMLALPSWVHSEPLPAYEWED